MRVLRLIPVLLLAACMPARAEMPDSDPRAIQVADQVMKALGGKERWDALPGLRWTFQSATGDTLRPGRQHAWDKHAYKLRDPGVHLKYDGEAREGGEAYDKLALSFESVGDTPGDHYWVYVNRKNHRVEKWAYVLQGTSPPPEVWTWEGWEEHGGLWFPTVHRNGDHTVYTRDVETVNAFPAALFRTP
jgi:hypothetical protein